MPKSSNSKVQMRPTIELTAFMMFEKGVDQIVMFPIKGDHFIPLIAPSWDTEMLSKMRECAASVVHLTGAKIIERRYKLVAEHYEKVVKSKQMLH